MSFGYPRPQLERENWLDLCGLWDYAITTTARRPATWDGQIKVPFSPEAPASGVSRLLHPGEYLWYHRTVSFPTCGDRVLLHFGAVDQKAVVWCNGKEVASHLGGYTPFTADLTEALDADRQGELLVFVQDGTDTTPFARGKQRLKRGNIWYTPQSGIWQPVWAETVPADYIRSLRITPLYDEAAVEIVAEPGGTVEFMGTEYPSPARIPVPDFIPWSPETPQLYPFTVRLGEDEVKSYFAMRKITVENARLCLNGVPYFQNGIIDQGYNPEGLYTYPSEDAMLRDLELIKEMGFNTVRKHMKTEPLRWYYHCDRLGLLVWQDMPSGGGAYSSMVVTFPIVGSRTQRDDRYSLFGRGDRIAREQYYDELGELIDTFYNAPCIVLWTAFNAGWGQFDSEKVRRFILGRDSTRLVDPASGWHDQGTGSIQSLHVYFRRYRHRSDKLGRAVILSSFGGYNLRIWGHTWNEQDHGHNSYPDADAFENAFRRLYEKEILPAKEAGLSAAVYAQFTDIEDEINGLVTYDRQVVKLPPDTIRRIITM